MVFAKIIIMHDFINYGVLIGTRLGFYFFDSLLTEKLQKLIIFLHNLSFFLLKDVYNLTLLYCMSICFRRYYLL